MAVLAGMVDCYRMDIDPRDFDYSLDITYPDKLSEEELMYSHGLTDGDAYMEGLISSPGYPNNPDYMRGYEKALKEYFGKDEWLTCPLESDELQSLDTVK